MRRIRATVAIAIFMFAITSGVPTADAASPVETSVAAMTASVDPCAAIRNAAKETCDAAEEASENMETIEDIERAMDLLGHCYELIGMVIDCIM